MALVTQVKRTIEYGTSEYDGSDIQDLELGGYIKKLDAYKILSKGVRTSSLISSYFRDAAEERKINAVDYIKKNVKHLFYDQFPSSMLDDSLFLFEQLIDQIIKNLGEEVYITKNTIVLFYMGLLNHRLNTVYAKISPSHFDTLLELPGLTKNVCTIFNMKKAQIQLYKWGLLKRNPTKFVFSHLLRSKVNYAINELIHHFEQLRNSLRAIENNVNALIESKVYPNVNVDRSAATLIAAHFQEFIPDFNCRQTVFEFIENSDKFDFDFDAFKKGMYKFRSLLKEKGIDLELTYNQQKRTQLTSKANFVIAKTKDEKCPGTDIIGDILEDVACIVQYYTKEIKGIRPETLNKAVDIFQNNLESFLAKDNSHIAFIRASKAIYKFMAILDYQFSLVGLEITDQDIIRISNKINKQHPHWNRTSLLKVQEALLVNSVIQRKRRENNVKSLKEEITEIVTQLQAVFPEYQKRLEKIEEKAFSLADCQLLSRTQNKKAATIMVFSLLRYYFKRGKKMKKFWQYLKSNSDYEYKKIKRSIYNFRHRIRKEAIEKNLLLTIYHLQENRGG